jgi:hypothetical protein
MPARIDDKRWESKFAKFVTAYPIPLLASRLRVRTSAIYQWIGGNTSPHPVMAFAIQSLARRRRVALTLDEIYQPLREGRYTRRSKWKTGLN